MSYSEGELYYDHIERHWNINGKELHCGDVFSLRPEGEWETVRIEYNHGIKEFYTIPHIPLQEGLKARYRR